MRRLQVYSRLLRCEQWVKNLFVFAPLVFSGSFLSSSAVVWACFGCVLFSLSASLIYIVNDTLDRSSDRLHPVKSVRRPIACGEVSLREALWAVCVLALLVLLGCLVRPTLFWPIGGYIALNVLYSLWLKCVPVLELFCVAMGFYLRVLVGAVVIQVPLTVRMATCVFSLALFLVGMKRLVEFDSAQPTRAVLARYSKVFLCGVIGLSALAAIIFYAAFAYMQHVVLLLTVPLVVVGMCRYITQAMTTGSDDCLQVCLSDSLLQCVVLAWAVSATLFFFL